MIHRTTPRRAGWFGFSVVSNDPAFVSALDVSFADLPTSSAPVTDVHVEFGPEGAVVSVGEPGSAAQRREAGLGYDAVVEELWWELNRRALASAAGLVALHAAVVGTDTGVVVVCGDSGAGKSTLAAAGARRGWRYGGDEFAFIDAATSCVTPFPRPVTLRPDSPMAQRSVADAPEGLSEIRSTVLIPASTLGADVLVEPTPLRAFVTLTGRPGALAPLRPASSLMELCRHSASLAARGAEEFFELEGLARSVPATLLGQSDPQEMLDHIASFIGG